MEHVTVVSDTEQADMSSPTSSPSPKPTEPTSPQHRLGKRKADATEHESPATKRIRAAIDDVQSSPQLDSSPQPRRRQAPIPKRAQPYETPSTTIAIRLPTSTWVDILKNGLAGASRNSINNVVNVMKSPENMPVAVQSVSAEHFTIEVAYPRYGTTWKCSFLTSSQNTVYDLAKAIEKVASIPVTFQRLDIARSVTKKAGIEKQTHCPNEIEDGVKKLSVLGLSEGDLVLVTEDYSI